MQNGTEQQEYTLRMKSDCRLAMASLQVYAAGPAIISAISCLLEINHETSQDVCSSGAGRVEGAEQNLEDESLIDS